MARFNLRNHQEVDYLFQTFIQAETVNSDKEHLTANVISLVTLGLKRSELCTLSIYC